MIRRFNIWWHAHEARAERRWEQHYIDQSIAAADRRRYHEARIAKLQVQQHKGPVAAALLMRNEERGHEA